MHKLKRRSEFQRVYKKGRSFKEEKIVLCLAPNNSEYNRIGISVSSRCAPLSVRRNRSKRLLLESYRLTEDSLKKGYDIVLIAKRDISESNLENVKRNSVKLYKKAHILT